MSFQISDIILYGPTDEPRILTLRPSQLNIVTGSSKTGKSSLISIVEYCLGASECGVAYGPIRSTVEWYALRLVLPNQQILVARKAPDEGRETDSSVYYEVASEVEIPPKSSLTPSTNINAAVDLLSRVAGIGDNIHEPPPGQTRRPLAATIKHALFFCFQPQDEIISRKNLFFRQGEPFIPQTIKDVLPYFLGAIRDDHIVKIGRIRRLRQDLKRVARKLDEAEALRGKGTTRAMSLLAEARDIGLVQLPESELTFEESIELLREVLERRLPSAPDLDASADTSQYDRLLEEREQLTRQLRRTDTDLRAARALVREQGGYAAEVAEHVGRLRSIGLFPDTDEAKHSCPLCCAEVPELPSDDDLRHALSTLERRLVNVDQDTPHLEQLMAQLENQVQELRQHLTENRASLDTLQRSQRQIAEYRDFVGRSGHIRGRISIYLEAVPEVSDDVGDLNKRAHALTEEITKLEEELSEESVEDRLDSLLSVVSHYISESGQFLDLEHSEHPLRFDVKKLTVVADTPIGPVTMDKMGSGANWVGYHIAVHLALHKIYVEAHRPVPQFLFLDQPSQVYFPADRDIDGRLEIGRDGAIVDEDRTAVLRMFELVRNMVASVENGFQVIITEHADPAVEWYQQAVVERWRDGKALIPQSWINEIQR